MHLEDGKYVGTLYEVMAFPGSEIAASFFLPESDGNELKRKELYLIDFMYPDVEKIHVREALLTEKSSGKIILHCVCCKTSIGEYLIEMLRVM